MAYIAAAGAATGGAMIAAVLEVALGVVSYVGMNAIESFGTSFFTKKAVPDIVKTGIGTLVTAKGAFTIFDINENNTGNNLLMDKVFDGDKESYEVCEECVDWLCESVITSGGLMPVPQAPCYEKGMIRMIQTGMGTMAGLE